MRIQTRNNRKWVTLGPGEYYVSNKKLIMETLLGSCVSACLYDPVNRVAGLNHFLLCNQKFSRKIPIYATEAGRYGIHSMELLINKMINKGAEKRYMKAKAFGGGHVLNFSRDGDNFFDVGDINVQFIREFLEVEDIPLVASSLGGDSGRVIRFDTTDHSVYVRTMGQDNQKAVVRRDKAYWTRMRKEREKEKKFDPDWNVDLWQS